MVSGWIHVLIKPECVIRWHQSLPLKLESAQQIALPFRQLLCICVSGLWCAAFQWFLLALQGANGALAQFLGARAFQLSDASLIAPIDFVRLPMVGFGAFLLFQEVPSLSTWYGAIIIFIAFLVLTYGSRKNSNNSPSKFSNSS